MSRYLSAAALLACLSAHALGQPTPVNLADPQAEFKTFPEPINLPTLSDPGEGSRVWASTDYLMWWIKPVCLKPYSLLSYTAPNPAAAAEAPGGFNVVQGGYKFEFKGLNGARLNLGMWLDGNHSLGVEGNAFLLEQGNASQNFQSRNGGPATVIPYLDPQNQKRYLPFSVPGVMNGTSIATGHSWLWGTEANLVAAFGLVTDDVAVHADLLLGARYLNLRDKVEIYNQLSPVGDPGSFAFGAANFTTHNQFYGGQVGLRIGLDAGRWSLLYANKIALGETHQVVEVTGSPLLGGTGGVAAVPGPVLAAASNFGRQSSSRFSVVPEASFTVRFRWTNHISTSLGYSALYWNKVLCPGDQMDQALNPTQLPNRGPATGARLPAPLFVQTDFFAQGYNVGIEFEY